MKNYVGTFGSLVALAVLGFQAQIVHSQAASASGKVQVHMVITNEALQAGDDVPVLKPENVQVKQGKTTVRVTHVIPAQGENAALQLFILIDDTCDSSIGNNLNDIRDFVNAQPATTAVAIGYMSNTNVQITQDFTVDHALAAKAIRLPLGRLSSMDSPYLSLMSLLKRWPQQKVRREIILVSDGIDRLHGEGMSGNQFGAQQSMRSPMMGGSMSSRNQFGGFPSATTMPTISVDADSASLMSQRYGVIVHGIYSPGVGRLGRNSWEAQLGQSGIGKIADETGGEYFALGYQNAVSFKPYLDRLQKVFENQYYLVFEAVPQKKAGLQRVKISSEAATTEIAAADNVWVPLKTEPGSNGD
jgi:hypothetical protein